MTDAYEEKRPTSTDIGRAIEQLSEARLRALLATWAWPASDHETRLRALRFSVEEAWADDLIPTRAILEAAGEPTIYARGR